jgi:hypothetical protein
MNNFKLIFLFLIVTIFSSCDHGLKPPESITPGILKGKVNFINAWPEQDSVFGIRAGAFKSLPSENLIQEVIDGNAYFNLETLGYNIDSANFQFIIEDLPVELKYIIIAWQFESDLSMQRVVGVYNLNKDKKNPASVLINKGETVNIEIEVDWNEFPPQPF